MKAGTGQLYSEEGIVIKANHTKDAQRGDILLINVDEVAGLLGISVRTVWRLASTGEIPAPIQLGGSRRWVRSVLEQHIERLAAQANN